MYVIGIDGGGTNSRAALCDETGRIYAFAKAGPVNQNSVPLQKVEKEFQSLIQHLRQQAPHTFDQVTYVFAGVAGTGKEEARLRIQEMLDDLIATDISIEVQHDGYNALFAGTLGKPGIVQISGTGSLTFGLNSHGDIARAGGWGYLFGDEGSGYALGRDALSAMAKAQDGWGDSTKLTNYILDHFSIENPQDIIPYIYNQDHPRQHIAKLSHYVMDAASQNDPVALDILQKASHDLANQIIAVVSRLFPDDQEPVPVVLTGGVFSRADLFLPSIDQTFDQQNINVQLIQPTLSPLGGAVIAAYRSTNTPVDQTFDQHFMAHIHTYGHTDQSADFFNK